MMKEATPPKFTKEDVREFLSDKDIKTILELIGYQIVPKCKSVYSYENNADVSNRFVDVVK